MNAKTLLIALSIGSALATSGIAAEKVKPKSKEKQVKPAPQTVPVEKNVLLTGSYIKRDVRRDGLITDGPLPVYVLDSEAIRTSGAADLSQLLLRRGFHR